MGISGNVGSGKNPGKILDSSLGKMKKKNGNSSLKNPGIGKRGRFGSREKNRDKEEKNGEKNGKREPGIGEKNPEIPGKRRGSLVPGLSRIIPDFSLLQEWEFRENPRGREGPESQNPGRVGKKPRLPEGFSRGAGGWEFFGMRGGNLGIREGNLGCGEGISGISGSAGGAAVPLEVAGGVKIPGF